MFFTCVFYADLNAKMIKGPKCYGLDYIMKQIHRYKKIYWLEKGGVVN